MTRLSENVKMTSKKLKIWSFRHSIALGNHVVCERECGEADAQAWLKIFRDDEPNVCFIADTRKPKVKSGLSSWRPLA